MGFILEKAGDQSISLLCSSLRSWKNPMSLKATSIRLDDETKRYATREEWFLFEVEKGVKAAEEGRLIDHKNIKAKWEAKLGNFQEDRRPLERRGVCKWHSQIKAARYKSAG